MRRHGASAAFPARVTAVAHELDLALLTVDETENPGFWSEPTPALPLRLGGLPRLQEGVRVLGFPATDAHGTVCRFFFFSVSFWSRDVVGGMYG